MGRKIPPANDGSNYYTARKGNRIEGVSFENAILDEIQDFPDADAVKSRGVKGTHILVDGITLGYGNNFTFSGGNGGGIFTTIAPINTSTFTIPAYTTVPRTNTLWSASGQWVLDSEQQATDFLLDTTLTLEQKALLHEQYTVKPDHEWNPSIYGPCDDCPTHNMYRRDSNSHLFVIQELPSQQDWQDQLAS